MCDEIGEQGTYHTHIFFIAKNSVMFDTVHNRFMGAHIEKANGTNTENYNYIRKIGEKYENKKETNLPNTFEEFGTMPEDKKGNSTLSEEILEMIENGCKEYEIIKAFPSAINKINNIRQTIEIINKEKFKDKRRNITVLYIWGKSGAGKTSHVMNMYGDSNVYRVTDYKHPFDDYDGQKILVFEEFRSSLDIADMLKYLDLYPIMLPCRYANKVAMFETIYILTNIPIEEQYIDAQKYEPETYNAFLRRITRCEEFLG